MPMVVAPIFCLDRPFGFSIQWGLFALSFAQAALSDFQPSRIFSFSYFQMWYLQSLSMLIGQSISSPSKSVILVALPDMIFLIIKILVHLGFIFPLGSKVSSLSTFGTKSPSLRFLCLTFLLNSLAILFWYPCARYYALALFSSIKANCSCLFFTQSSSRTLVSASTLKDCISTLIGSTASLLQTNEQGVALVNAHIEVS